MNLDIKILHASKNVKKMIPIIVYSNIYVEELGIKCFTFDSFVN